MAYQLRVKAYELAQDRGRTVVGHEAANNASENESSWYDRQVASYLVLGLTYVLRDLWNSLRTAVSYDLPLPGAISSWETDQLAY